MRLVRHRKPTAPLAETAPQEAHRSIDELTASVGAETALVEENRQLIFELRRKRAAQ
jgi:hypothetical protein